MKKLVIAANLGLALVFSQAHAEYNHVQAIIDSHPKPEDISDDSESASLALLYNPAVDKGGSPISHVSISQVDNLRECFSLAYNALLDTSGLGYHGKRIVSCVSNRGTVEASYSCKGFNHGVLCKTTTTNLLRPD